VTGQRFSLFFFLQFLKDIEEELYKVQLEEEDIRRRINLSNQIYGQLPWKYNLKNLLSFNSKYKISKVFAN